MGTKPVEVLQKRTGFAFFLKKPLVFTKVISEVFNKAIKKGRLCKERHTGNCLLQPDR